MLIYSRWRQHRIVAVLIGLLGLALLLVLAVFLNQVPAAGAFSLSNQVARPVSIAPLSMAKNDAVTVDITVKKPLLEFVLVSPSERRVNNMVAFSSATTSKKKPARAASELEQDPEKWLIEIYRQVNSGDFSEALRQAQALVRKYPNFQLAQLVLGDLLLIRAGKTEDFEASAQGTAFKSARGKSAKRRLENLRVESKRRLEAMTQPLPHGYFPKPFALLAPNVRHAIAVDANKSRLYLFEQNSSGFRLLDDFYISVGSDGVDKVREGDKRTPSGLYYINGRIDKKDLTDFYGAGALPIDYPNVVDTSAGRTGSGIWLHGSPSRQFARAPEASAGCVVLSNPDMDALLRTVDFNNTPVVIAPSLEWISTEQLASQRQPLLKVVTQWAQALSNGSTNALKAFNATASVKQVKKKKSLSRLDKQLPSLLSKVRGEPLRLENISLLQWTENQPYAILSFDLLTGKERSPSQTLRQYWVQEQGEWRILSMQTL